MFPGAATWRLSMLLWGVRYERRSRRIHRMPMLFMTSLLLGRVHPFGDAALYAPKAAPGSIMAHSSVPPDVRATLEAKCADCHSTQTRPYIYGRFAPVSWLMERDILEGRRQMNLSSWDTYSADQQLTFEAKIVKEMKCEKCHCRSIE